MTFKESAGDGRQGVGQSIVRGLKGIPLFGILYNASQ
jgi:hypothetical protein